MAEILVVGGSGFLGSHVSDALVAADHEIRVLTRDPAGTRAAWPGAAHVQLLPGSFLDARTLREALDKIDVVLHFASTTNPVTSAETIDKDVHENILGTIGLLESAVDAGVERVLFASTGGAIYGAYPGRPLREYDPTIPVSPYAIGKLAVEGYLRFFRARYGLESIALRISNPYGPRQDPSRGQGVISTFIEQARRGEAVTIFGDGSMVRDYIYVDDVARIVAAIVDHDAPHPILNVGSGIGTSVAELREAVGMALGRAVDARFEPARASDVAAVILDPSLLLETYGLQAEITLTAGIASTIAAIEAAQDTMIE